jgi:hypothetical protein
VLRKVKYMVGLGGPRASVVLRTPMTFFRTVSRTARAEKKNVTIYWHSVLATAILVLNNGLIGLACLRRRLRYSILVYSHLASGECVISASDIDGAASGTRCLFARPRILAALVASFHSDHNRLSFIGGGATRGAHNIQSRLIVALLPLVVGRQVVGARAEHGSYHHQSKYCTSF